ncbi:uncharacterized protein LOC105384433 isoform X2 [Plutella xylostella]|uniref:uncharacterized protein LOC105384433 isoform X2 n=1 Tax=Plutella xylostella TaxID=51655 RepID=UPI00203236FE|nr:uncharacterized protein LOC105384433 isoform X2 [Plutella xylostella]
MEAVSISEKQAAEAAEVDLEEQVKRTDEQLDMMSWKMDNVEKQLEVPGAPEEAVIHLMKSVTELLQFRCARTTTSCAASWSRSRLYSGSSPAG